jgi:hypothetical protein
MLPNMAMLLTSITNDIAYPKPVNSQFKPTTIYSTTL